MLKLIDKITRPCQLRGQQGLDEAQHGESAYAFGSASPPRRPLVGTPRGAARRAAPVPAPALRVVSGERAS